jgi:hypothetical protein
MRRPSRSASQARPLSAFEPSGGAAPRDANSVRHNRPGGHVAVIIEAVSEERSSLCILDDGHRVSRGALHRFALRFRPSESGGLRVELEGPLGRG